MKKSSFNATAIVVAGGTGTRMGGDIPKQFIEVFGKPIISYTLNALSKCTDIRDIIIVTLPEYIVYCNDIVNTFGFDKVKKIVCGGDSRSRSVFNGLKEVEDDCNIVAIHDGVRPLIDCDTVSACIRSAAEYGCAAVGVKMKDTVKVCDEKGFIKGTADREKLWMIQTPQVFKKDIIYALHQEANEKKLSYTDDCLLAEAKGYKLKIVEGKYENIKITTPQDIYIMKGLIGE